MGTIKLKRPLSGNQGTPPTEAQLAENEIAMDASVGEIYVGSSSTDSGTDAAILANKYEDGDAVTAIEDASSLTLSGTVDVDDTLTAMGGFTVDAQYNANPLISYSNTLFAKRSVDGGANSGDRSVATLWRDLDSEVINSGYDNRGTSLDYVLQSDNQGTTQYLGGVSMQSGGTGSGDGHWVKAWSYDDGVSTFAQDTIFEANYEWFYTYGRIMAQRSATLQNPNGDDEAPLVVKADWDNNPAVAAEFFNIADDDQTVSIKTGTDQGFGSLTYNNQLRSWRDGDRKYQYFDVLNDDGTFNETLYEMHKDTNTGDMKHNLYGQVRVELGPSATTPNTSLQIQTDMSNATSDFSTGVKTNLNWGSGTIPNDAESFQEFTVQDDTQGQLKVGYFGSRYKSANNGELSTMKLVAQTHDNSSEAELSINQKQAESTVPFKFVNMTTTERNALSSPDSGTVIYNETDNKLQVRTTTAWVDLH
jgi:hypothetical protein